MKEEIIFSTVTSQDRWAMGGDRFICNYDLFLILLLIDPAVCCALKLCGKLARCLGFVVAFLYLPVFRRFCCHAVRHIKKK